MTDEELSDALDGLKAYDSGCIDSGIHDEVLRERVKAELAASSMTRISRIVREMRLSDEALAQGYTLEDVASILRWLDDRMGLSL